MIEQYERAYRYLEDYGNLLRLPHDVNMALLAALREAESAERRRAETKAQVAADAATIGTASAVGHFTVPLTLLEPFLREADRLSPPGSYTEYAIGDSCELWQCGGDLHHRCRITYGDLRRLRAAQSSPAPRQDRQNGRTEGSATPHSDLRTRTTDRSE